MRAVVQDRYGPPELLTVRDIDQPVAGAGEVLVRVHAASVHPDVWHVLTGQPYLLRLMGAGLRRPRNPVPGTDVAGRVAAVGSGVARFQPGDPVFGETMRGFQWRNGGAFAEYVAVPQEALAPMPASVSFEQAAAVPTAGLITLMNLPVGRRAPAPGRRVLVNGAGGGVGGFAVQLAKARGAEVTGVDRPEKLALVRSLGADHVVDYTREDFTRAGQRYHLIVDIPGNHPFSACRRALTPDGTYVLIGHDRYGTVGHRWLGSVPRVLGLVARSPFTRQLPPVAFSTPDKQELMDTLRELLAQGTLTPVVDRTYPLEQVPDAIRYLASGAAQGKVVITIHSG